MEEDNDVTYNDPVVKHDTIGNLEGAKHAFFNGNLDEFVTEMKSKEYKYYKATYKYWDDYTGRPDFIARNLNRGFVQNLDDKRKYFLTCFRCNETEPKTYQFVSYWVVNTSDHKKVLDSTYDDFDWEDVTFDVFFENFKRNPDNCVTEDYLH